MTWLIAALMALGDAAGAPGISDERDRDRGLVLAIDACVDVDRDEVRRLVVLELRHGLRASSASLVSVVVDCLGGLQQVRLVAPERADLASRTVDLGVLPTRSRDAKNRELALAIAELVRRGGGGPDPAPPPASTTAATTAPAPAPPPVVSTTAVPSLSAVAPTITAAPWRTQVSALVNVEHWSGGQVQWGPDLACRVRITRHLSADLRVGGRRSRATATPDGQLTAVALGSAAGLAIDVAPDARRATLLLGARMAGGLLWYTATSDLGTPARTGSAGSLAVVGGPQAHLALTSRLRLLAEITVGRALHTVTIVDQGVRVSALSGLGLSGALGLVAQF